MDCRSIHAVGFFIDTVQGHPEVQHSIGEADAEEERIHFIDDVAPVDAAIPVTSADGTSQSQSGGQSGG